MFIKYLILDGFKSYRERTQVGAFDPHFNAITGYNGSGKSNILDGICFVLGLSSLSTVRAANLADLVNKGSGLTGCSVSMVFDNTDKRPGKCPVGFEKYDELIISRNVENLTTCKYFLNGLNSPKKYISDMLESVQLNVNHPNFVIMQGKITKVVNMKPKEILLMIEESVGATIYQSKRDKTQKELEQKERDFDAIRETMLEIINPALQKQQQATNDIAEFNLLTAEVNEKTTNYYTALYHEKKVELSVRKSDLQKVLTADKKDDDNMLMYQEKIKTSKARIKEMKEQGRGMDEDIAESEKVMTTFKKKMILAEAELNSAKLNEADAKEKIKETMEALQVEEKDMEQYKMQGKALIGEFNTVKEEMAKAEADLEKAKHLEGELKMGAIVDESGNAMNAIKQHQDLSQQVLRLKTDIEIQQVDQKRFTEKVTQLRAQLKNTPPHAEVEKRYNDAFRRVEEMRKEAQRYNFDTQSDPKDYKILFRDMDEKYRQVQRMKKNIFDEYPNLNFYYKPSRDINPDTFLGCGYNIVKFKDVETWGTALEVAAMGFLLHVIVSARATGVYLMKPGVMPRRATVHPLDVWKCEYRYNVTQADLDRKLGKGKAVRVLDLAEYDKKYHDLVQYYLGGKILVQDQATAKKAAYEHGFFSIAKNGDSVDPDGIMQGGSRSDGGKWISAAQELHVINEQIAQLEQEKEFLQRERQFSEKFQDALYTLDSETKLKNETPFTVISAEIADLNKKIDAIKQLTGGWNAEKTKLEKEAAKLKTQLDNLDAIRAKLVKENQANIKKCMKSLETAKAKYQSNRKVYEDVNTDIKARETLIADCQKDVDKAEAEHQSCIDAGKIVREAFEVANAAYLEKDAIYQEKLHGNAANKLEEKRLEDAITTAKDKIHHSELSKMKRDNDRKDLTAAVQAIQERIDSIQAENPDFDLANTEPVRVNAKQFKKELEFLETRLKTMRERLDYEAAEKLAITKQKISHSDKKMAKVLKNKQNLRRVVETLDKHKMDIVTAAYDKINSEFNAMMGTLLPDSQARLVPVNPQDLMEGINIHVCLGGTWKESLTELSGGQRSLVALALVLSLCMYKPAPFYILDEIDAALDMNHTQNIGCLIRQRFKDTQFICVSLKDGMYTNSNILFQTLFTGGRSEVRRCVKKHGAIAPPPPPSGDNEEEENRAGPSKKKK